MPEFKTNSIDNIPAVVSEIINKFPDSRLFAFYGEMGSGKTTMIKEICKYLGVKEEVKSPTFALINEYFSPKNGLIYHFDFYRIKDLKEAFDLGIDEYFYSGSFCFIEWPELIEDFLPEGFVRIFIQDEGENKRLVSF